jgi:hypothetical protein
MKTINDPNQITAYVASLPLYIAEKVNTALDEMKSCGYEVTSINEHGDASTRKHFFDLRFGNDFSLVVIIKDAYYRGDTLKQGGHMKLDSLSYRSRGTKSKAVTHKGGAGVSHLPFIKKISYLVN